jgi:hypothetical protein
MIAKSCDALSGYRFWSLLPVPVACPRFEPIRALRDALRSGGRRRFGSFSGRSLNSGF